MSQKPGQEGGQGSQNTDPNANPAGNQPDPNAGGGDNPGGQGSSGQSGNAGEGGSGQGSDGFTDLAAANAEIKKLRGENAKHRTKNKDLEGQVSALGGRFSKLEKGLKGIFGEGEGDDLTPEQRLEKVQAQNEELQVETALRDAAWEHGVGKDDYEFFSFLVNKEMDKLKEGEELSDEVLTGLAQKAKSKSASSSTSVNGNGSEGNGNGGNPPPADPQDPDLPTPDEFAAMGIGQQSLLYQKLQAKGRVADYDKLWKASETKRRELKRQKRLY